MKGILVLLVLLNTLTTKVCSQPYQADSDRKCRDERTEYVPDDSDLCCKKCPPGARMIQTCSESSDTVCEPCPKGQYLEGWNFSPNCLSCIKCKSNKGLQYEQTCTSTSKSKCGCQPGKYCIMGYDGRSCGECSKYRVCLVGHGVSVQGTVDSNVVCQRCPNGTFSDTVSYTDRCRPHTDCKGRAVITKGTATSDNECEAMEANKTSTKTPHTENVSTTASTVMSAVSYSKTLQGPTNSTLSISTPVPEAGFNQTTPPSTASAKTLAAVLPAAVGVMLICIAIILLFRCRKHWMKDGADFHPKVDANGNCETGVKINPGYYEQAQLTSFTETSPEQHCLLVKGEACSDQSQSSGNTEASTRTDGCSSYESIGPLQSTVALRDPHCALSEPMPLLSNIDPVTPQTSIPTQYSSQPTSPQIINPPTTSPQFNVNINIHIGNGTGGTTPVTPTDLMQVDSKLPFGEEEQFFSIPQQEAGKQSLTSVQESDSYSS
ncbi:tumor necrosis factor receptor superfamily member 1B [Acanthopagrus latus]|uniref:tumor necrosis factor receptor superfamily member 1B n=1 Tax=Acanthopagrus latus TaxID=8177 RepID=UPI00187BDD69|nr:tumor necrosis factor receptor superfamily member 1B [Acanthopagrus latus]